MSQHINAYTILPGCFKRLLSITSDSFHLEKSKQDAVVICSSPSIEYLITLILIKKRQKYVPLSVILVLVAQPSFFFGEIATKVRSLNGEQKREKQR